MKKGKSYQLPVEAAIAIDMGAESIMDLSNYGKTNTFRKQLIDMSPAMIGTVPMYDAIGYLEKDLLEITAQDFLRVVEAHAREGVDFMTIHAGINRRKVEAFARDKGLQVQVSPVMSFNQRLEGLANGTYDVVAYGIPATSELKDSLLLTSPIILSKQVLVQRKVGENDSLAIRSQLDLAGKTLNVVKGSPSILRIRNLSNEIGDTIYVNEIEKYGSEQLIAMVAHGDIDYAVCDEGIARMAVDSLPQLDINTAISFTQFYSWGVSKQSPALLDSLNTWLSDFRKKGEYQSVYRKYYGKQ